MKTNTSDNITKLLSKLDQRRLSIIEYLISSQQKIISIQEIKTHFNVSTQTIISDLKHLIQLFPDKLQFEVKYKYIRLSEDFPPQANEFYQYYFHTSVYFVFIRVIFSRKIHSITYMQNKLFVSRSTLYRIIDNINAFFDKFYPGLKLNLKPFTIEGPERRIRKFYYDFFEFGYNLTEWPFTEVSHSNINNLSLFLRHFIPSLSLYSSHPMFQIILAINLIRCMTNNLVTDSCLPKDLSALYENLINAKAQFSIYHLENDAGVSIDTNTVRQLLVGLAPHSTYLAINSMEEVIQSCEKSSKAAETFYNEVDALIDQHQLTALDQDKKELLLLLLYNCCQDDRSLDSAYTHNNMSFTTLEMSNLKEKWELFVPGFYTEFYKILENFQKQFSHNISKERTEIMFSYFYSFYPLTINHFNKDYNQLYIGVYTSRSYITEELCNKLQALFGSLVKLQKITDTYAIGKIAHSKLDILLTTYPLTNIERIAVRTISSELTLDDLSWIYNMINHLKFNNKRPN